MESVSLAGMLAENALRIHRRLRQEEAIHGLTGARLAVLTRLIREGPLSVGDLAVAEQVASATMTRLITGLEEEKLVLRRQSPRDARVVEAVPTTLGRTLASSVERRRLQWLDAILQDMDHHDRSSLRTVTERLGERLRN